MQSRHFIETDADGVVVHELTVHRDDWSDVEVPPKLIDVTDDPTARGASLLGRRRLGPGRYEQQPARAPRVIATRALFERFTKDERIALWRRRGGADAAAADLDDAIRLMQMSPSVHLDDPWLAAWLNRLVAQALLTPARAQEIRA